MALEVAVARVAWVAWVAWVLVGMLGVGVVLGGWALAAWVARAREVSAFCRSIFGTSRQPA